jgi:large subunit ribosomal protein L3
MAKTILGKKVGMTQIFTEEGVMIPVTAIEAKPNKVIQIKTVETDGYGAVQIGFADLKESRANKPTKGHFSRWEAPLKKYLAEVRLEEGEAYAPGQEITVADFEEGKKLDVTGTSKGKGTQGNIKRHGHHRGPMSHGSKHKRLPGALAAGTYPSRVFKGNDGPGRMGRETVTVQNLELVKIIPERDILLVKGAVPGSRGSVLCVRYAVKAGYPDDVRLAVFKEAAPAESVAEEPVVATEPRIESEADVVAVEPEDVAIASTEEASAVVAEEAVPAEAPAGDDSAAPEASADKEEE